MKWPVLIVAGMLLVAVLAAGCTDEAPPPPPDQSLYDPIEPGQVLALGGYVTGDGLAGGAIDTITVPVQLVAGQKSVDMTKISVVYADTVKTETLVPAPDLRGEPAQGEWAISTVQNEIGDPNNRLDDKEVFVLKLNPRSYLPAKRMVMIVIRTPGPGAPLTIRRFAPDNIVAYNNILESP